jgi:hypothetical protein
MKYRLFFVQLVLLAMMGFWGPAHAQIPQLLTTHDANQTSQHNSLSGQVTTHDSAQTSQHNELKGKIDNLGDHSGLPPTWDKILPADNPGGPCPSNSSRFTCVMGGAAVRDNETGLVWERSPTDTNISHPNWLAAQDHCNTLTVGNRKGWRLPTIQELASLVDPTQSQPALPAGHPFSNVGSSLLAHFYWSATTSASTAGGGAWVVDFDFGGVALDAKSDSNGVWCVRGGQGVDPQ